ncbi:MAG: hypothetical protein HKO89_04380, partial [Saprospiraceae bacterium]|nr:hypothetical protein [Saprospiraceae bacterium]
MKLAQKLFAICLLLCLTTGLTYGQILMPDDCNASGALGENLLNNPGFESNTAGVANAGGFQSAAGWNFFGAGWGNVYIEEPFNPFSPCGDQQPPAKLGTKMLKIFGQFNGGFNASGAFTNPIPASPGETFVGGIHMLSPSFAECPVDNLQFDNRGQVHVEFLDAVGNIVGYTSSPDFTVANAVSGYFKFQTVAVAPEGTAQVRLATFFFQFPVAPFAGGAIYYDEAFLQLKEEGGTAPQLSCNNSITVTVNGSCASDITTDMLLEGDFDPLYYDFSVADNVGTPVDLSDLSAWIDRDLVFTVHDLCSDNTCWGNITFEDKTPPTVTCDCPVGGETGVGDYAEECTLTCWELPLLKEKYWDRLRDNLVPEMVDDFLDDHVSDNCDAVTEDDISYYDVYVDLGPCIGTLLRRTWTVTYTDAGSSGTVSCTREYFFKPVGLETLTPARIDPASGAFEIIEDSLILPPSLVELTCGADISPAGIAAYFDNPASTDND